MRRQAATGQAQVTIAGIRREQADATIRTFAILMAPTALASVSRAFTVGWQPVLSLHLGGLVGLLIILAAGRRLSFPIRAGLFGGIILTWAVVGMFSWGLIGMGIFLFLICAVLGTMFFGANAGRLLVALGILVIVVAGFAVAHGKVTFDFDIRAYSVSPFSWGLAAMAFALYSFALVSGLGRMHQAFVKALRIVQDSEGKYRELVHLLPEPVLESDCSGRLTFANDRAAEVFGYTAADFDAGVTFSSLFAERDRPKADEQLAGVLAERTWPETEHTMARRDGSTFVALVRCARILRADEAVGLRIVIIDVTAARQLELERFRNEKLESLGLLAGGIAHDFNNLLTVIIGNLSLARVQHPGDVPLVRALTDAESASTRARDLTTQLLTFSRGGGVVREVLSPGPLLVEAASFALRGSAVKSALSVPDDVFAVNANPAQISQLINNLALNAVQAMPNGGTLHLSLANVSLEEDEPPLTKGHYVCLTVADEGAGIPPEVLPHIFDPYFTTKPKGSGLGLATVHWIVQQHRGHLAVDSTPGRGTVFRIHLPATPHAAPAPKVAEAPGKAGRAARILVMDDEDLVRRVAREILLLAGHEVVVCADGDAALRLYAEAGAGGRPFELVITDATVPGGMGGHELARALRKIDPNAKVVLSTGYSSNDKDLGVVEFNGTASKPYTAERLLAVVDAVLQQ
ncbi:MAG: PAS domain S-box protein [Deltaproteobacteria bacterium]|nr:PAS domain S-box protein [Deltaproteobacteria bacterium]